MTSKELSQIYYLKKEIRYLEDTLNELRAKAEKITTSFSDVRSGGAYGDKIAASPIEFGRQELQKIKGVPQEVTSSDRHILRMLTRTPR